MGGYTNNFYDSFPEREMSCSLQPCHGGGANPPNVPLIPTDPAALNMQPTLDQAMMELWTSAQPGTPDSDLVYSHSEGGPNMLDWKYSTAQLDFLRAFVMKGESCKWKGVTPGPGECPVPVTDFSACGP
jgi:hypothetical protein